MRAIAEDYERRNVPPLGNLPLDRPEGAYRFMFCQLNGASSKETKEIKSFQVQQLVNKYSVQGVALAEHGTNFSGVKSSAGMKTWFNE